MAKIAGISNSVYIFDAEYRLAMYFIFIGTLYTF